jgi:hypothetical protein
MDLRLEPLVPAGVMAMVALATVMIAVLVYRRPSWPAWLRLAAVLLVAALLANPVLVHGAAERLPARLALVLDTSASMAVHDPGAQGTRLERGRAALATIEHALGGRYRIETFSLADALTAGSAASAAGGTSFDALARFTESPPAALILASDGGDRGTIPPDQALAAAQVPVFALAIGSQAPACNAAVRLEPSSPTAFPGQDVTLTAVVTATGDALGRQSDLVITAADGAEVLHRTVTLSAEQQLAVALSVGDGAGERSWSARLAPVAGEVTDADNRSAAVVEVVDRAIRLVVIEGQPYWDTSFAVRAWRRDRQLAVASTYRVGNRRLRAGKDVPETLTAESLKSVDVVVIGAQTDSLLDAAQAAALVAFVDHGGGLLFLGAGSDRDAASPLSALDPLLHRQGRRDEVVPSMTDAGRHLALLPTGDAGAALARVASGLIADVRPRTDILVGSGQQPLVVSRRQGAGMVASVNAEGMWRWTLNAHAESDVEVAGRFWRQLVKTLVHDEQGRLSSDRPRYRVGQEALISAPGDAPVVVHDPDHQPVAVTISQGAGRLACTKPGLYSLDQGARRLTLIVEPDVREITDIQRRDDRLARLTSATAGALVEVEQAATIATLLSRRADLQVVAPQTTPLVTSPWWVAVLAVLLGGEWFVRRRRHGVV